jgi:hypothetical protein
MLRIERAGKRLVGFEDLAPKPIGEFFDLTDFVVNSPEAFFGSIGERLFVLGAHVPLAREARASLDVLAMDEDGCPVAVVIDGGGAEAALARAVAAASRLAAWAPEEFFRLLTPARGRELRAFLGPNVSAVNSRQRVLVVGERSDREALLTANWLRSRGVDIGFVEVAMAVDPRTGDSYLRCRMSGSPGTAALPSATASAPAPPTAPGWDDPALKANAGAAPAPLPLDPDALFDDEPFGDPAAVGSAATAQAPVERRSAGRAIERQPSAVEVEYAGRKMGASLADFSTGGVGLTMNHPLPIGSLIRVRRATGAPIDATGRVRHCRFDGQTFRLGVAFEAAGA